MSLSPLKTNGIQQKIEKLVAKKDKYKTKLKAKIQQLDEGNIRNAKLDADYKQLNLKFISTKCEQIGKIQNLKEENLRLEQRDEENQKINQQTDQLLKKIQAQLETTKEKLIYTEGELEKTKAQLNETTRTSPYVSNLCFGSKCRSNSQETKGKET